MIILCTYACVGVCAIVPYYVLVFVIECMHRVCASVVCMCVYACVETSVYAYVCLLIYCVRSNERVCVGQRDVQRNAKRLHTLCGLRVSPILHVSV